MENFFVDWTVNKVHEEVVVNTGPKPAEVEILPGVPFN